jgi:hypothetical protein
VTIAPYAGSSDVFGKLTLDPVPVNTDRTIPTGDPALVVIGEFVKAVMMSRLNAAWSSLGGASIGSGSDIVKTISYNNPEDNTYNLKDLPGLYVFQPTDKQDQFERYADCQFWNIRYVTVLWIPQPRDQIQRADRAPFFNAIFKAVKGALVLDRFPGYVIVGDTDTFAANWGSSLMLNAGLAKEIASDDDIECQVIDVKIDMPPGGGDMKKVGDYEGARFNLRIYEDLDVSQTSRGATSPLKLDAILATNGAITITGGAFDYDTTLSTDHLLEGSFAATPTITDAPSAPTDSLAFS